MAAVDRESWQDVHLVGLLDGFLGGARQHLAAGRGVAIDGSVQAIGEEQALAVRASSGHDGNDLKTQTRTGEWIDSLLDNLVPAYTAKMIEHIICEQGEQKQAVLSHRAVHAVEQLNTNKTMCPCVR